MSDNQPSLFGHRSFRITAYIVLALLLLARIGYGQFQGTDRKLSVLQGSIHLQPVQKLADDHHGEKIQPGTAVKLVVTVENKGMEESPAGLLYVRYAFAHPLDSEKSSIIFETEKKTLPSIEPGKKVDIAFETPHQIPSLLDFVRNDWSLREYQAFAVIDHKENMIGSLAITFSAYYYPGIKKEFPVKVAP